MDEVVRMSNLKPCPCCNGISWVYYRAFTTYVYCDKCGLRTKDYDTEAEAIEAWNRRANDADGKAPLSS